MKKCLPILLLALMTAATVYSQSQRKVLLEHFTQASCPPCATYNPGVQAILNANPNKIVAIKYQTSWPGYDPMNLHNPSEVAARVAYYPPSWGVPHSQIDGGFWGGHPSNWNIGTINARYNVPSPLHIDLSHTISPNHDSVYVKMVVRATQAVSGNLRAHIVVQEELIHFANPPGSNGETDFRNVMKKMLPNSSGTTLPASMSLGDSIVIQESWKFANVYDYLQIAVAGFVQDNNTKYVHQAEYSPPLPPAPSFNYDVAVLEISGLPASTCFGDVAPEVTIKNLGAFDLTSLDINYMANNGDMHTYQWSGNLPFWSETKVTLPMFNFDVEPSNELMIFSSNPNGNTDQNYVNDTAMASIAAGALVPARVAFKLRVDNSPQETTWELIDHAGNVIYSGGPYSQPLSFIYDTFWINYTDCYTFKIYDQGGDGICCSNGIGFYNLTDETGNIFVTGSGFGDVEINQFRVEFAGIGETTESSRINVYPNPFDGVATIDLDLVRGSEVEYSLYNMMGRRVLKSPKQFLPAGFQKLQLNALEFPDGIYFLKVKVNNEIYSEKITLIR